MTDLTTLPNLTEMEIYKISSVQLRSRTLRAVGASPLHSCPSPMRPLVWKTTPTQRHRRLFLAIACWSQASA